MYDFVISILGVFLGALLGIPCGLEVTRRWARRIDATRREQLRDALNETTGKNRCLLDEIEKQIDSVGGSPSFNVDLTLLESISSVKYEVLNDIDLCREIDKLRFELSHLSRKVDALWNLRLDASAQMAVHSGASGQTTSMYTRLRPMLVESILQHIQPIRLAIDRVQKQLR